MLTIAQIYAIVNLILAFGGTPDQSKIVESILLNSRNTIITSPTPAVGGSVSEVPRVTSPFVDLKVNGSKSPVYILKTGCIQLGVKTCGYGVVEWISDEVVACGGGGTPGIGWSGNYGTRGGKQGEFTATTTVVMKCSLSDGSFIEDSVEVYLK